MIVAAPKLEPIRKKLERVFQDDEYGRARISERNALDLILSNAAIHAYLRSFITSTQGLALGVSYYTEPINSSRWDPRQRESDFIYGLTIPKAKTELFIVQTVETFDGIPEVWKLDLRRSFFGENERFREAEVPLKYKDFSGWPSAQKLLVQTYDALKSPGPRIMDFAELTAERWKKIDVETLKGVADERVRRMGFVNPFYG